MSLGFPHRAQAGAAVGLAIACLALNAAPVFAASTVRGQEWWLQKLHVTQAQQSARAGGVTVAVLDTGVDPQQADLAGAVVTGPDYTDSGRVHGGPFWGIHGTAMASVIAGRGHGRARGAGILGVAPGATILSVRVTLENSDPLLADANIAASLPGAIARGIRYAVRHHASVIALPLDPVTTSGAVGAGGSTAERSAVAYALAHHVVLVAPAGDGGAAADPVNFPAAYHGVISVGAFNSAFTKAAFSSRQPYVTLTAAGDGVIAANGATGYAQVSSTTAASAVVAGIVALIRAQFPSLSPAQVTKALRGSTVFRPRGGQQTGSGAGTVDAAGALAAAARMIEAVPAPESSPAPTASAAQPPSPPAVHSPSGLGRTLLIDIGIAVAVFLLLAVPILGYARHRRRRARAARLAEVRAAAQPAARPQRATRSARRGATTTVEPEKYTYLPAPVGTDISTAGSPPTAGDSPRANGTGADAQSPWSPWGTGGSPGSPPGSGIPAPRSGSSFRGSAFTENAFPRAGYGSAAAHPADPPGRAGPARLARRPGPAQPPSGSAPAQPPSEGAPAQPPSESAPAQPPGETAPPAPGRRPASAGPPPPAPASGGPAHAGPTHAGPTQAGTARTGRAQTGKTQTGQGNAGPAHAGPAHAGPGHAGPGHAGPGHAGPPRTGGVLGGSTTGGGAVPGSGATSGPAAGGLIGPARAGAPRTPKVSGSPPWGPAPEPPGEVPWGRPLIPSSAGPPAFPTGSPPAVAPRPEFLASAPPEPPEPKPSPWDDIAQEAWPGGPGASRPSALSSRRQSPGSGVPGRDHDPESDRRDEEPSTGSQPIYVWNPGASTESLPAVPPDEDHER